MAQLTIEIHDTDMETLTAMAKRKWRDADKQASSLIEDAMAVERARANGTERRPGRRAGERLTGGPRNGVHSMQPATAG